jgi:2-polyprenyl-3-methyl-5-hydroxy-6-metoxy-1,4-benzoquinol methylase
MPRIKKNIVFSAAKNIQAFLRLDAGLGAQVPEDSESIQARLQNRIQEQQRMLAEFRKGDGSKNASKKIQSENPTGVLRQTHAIPPPDFSVKRNYIFNSLVSPLKPGKMLDLGTGPGVFSLMAADLGWQVTAVDARTVRMPDLKSEEDAKRAELIKSVEWVEADVRDYSFERDEYDLICFLGLMHHLGVEDQLKILRRCSDTLTLLSARVAPEVVVTEGPYEGSYYYEKGETREERDAIPSAAWGNDVSFHPTEESLVRMLRDCGFSKVMAMRPPHNHNYDFYLCLP